MSLTERLPDIENDEDGIYIIHEKFERFIDWHKHSKGQLSYCEGGIAYLLIKEKTYVVPSHYFFWIPVGVEHDIRVSRSATNIRSIYFGLGEEDSAPFFSDLGIYPASELIIQMINFTEKWSEQMILPSDERYLFLRAMLQVIIPQQGNMVPIIIPITQNEKLGKIVDYLGLNVHKQLTLSGVAAIFNVSERSLSRLFQSELHLSFLQYLKHLRIIKSIELLQKTNLSISEISERVGYMTQGAFSNTFFEMTQMRPSDMRKNFFD